MPALSPYARKRLVPGAMAGAAAAVTAAVCGRRDTGSAVAPLNAPSHILWGDDAAQVERVTWRHTLPGLLITGGAAIFWAAVMEKLFGRAMDRRGAGAAAAAGAATAAIAYVTDYHAMPHRLRPGYDLRVSRRSLFAVFAAMGAALAVGAAVARRRAG